MTNRDEFDDEGFIDSLLKRKDKVPMPFSLKRTLMVGGSIAVLVVLGVVLVSVMSGGGKAVDEASVPVIHADSQAYKIVPEDRGGMEVPNRDSTVFENLKNQSSGDKKVENILADDETPMKKDQVFAERAGTAPAASGERAVTGTATAKPDGSSPDAEPAPEKVPLAPDGDSSAAVNSAQGDGAAPVGAAKGENAIPSDDTKGKQAKADVKSEEPASAVTSAENKPAPTAPVAAPAVALPEKKSAADPAPKPSSTASLPKTSAKADSGKVATKAKGGVGAYVQLGAVKSDAEARAQWPKLQGQFSGLSGLSMRVQKADTAKGIFYRIQAGPVSEADARKICAGINAKKSGGCLVAKQ